MLFRSGENSRLPQKPNEIVLVVDKYNRLDQSFFNSIGISNDQEQYKLSDFIGKEILKVIPNNDFYTQSDELFIPASANEYKDLYESDGGITLTIVGILRPINDVGGADFQYMSNGFGFTSELSRLILEEAKNSEIAKAQELSDKNVLTGTSFPDVKAKTEMLLLLGVDSTPVQIAIFPEDFASKDKILEYLEKYNRGKETKDHIICTDLAAMVTEMTGSVLGAVT